jgi:hypothetical protein
MAYKRKLYIAALDCRDAFGSVSHQLLNVNLERLSASKTLRNLIMDSYRNSQVRIWSNGKASDPIGIKKKVKQGCPLSPLLFNICVDPLISYIKNAEVNGYVTEKLGDARIQAYVDDMILMSDTEDNLQVLINKAKQFFDFANIKLNPNKCEVMTVNPNKNDIGIVISGVRKDYISDNGFIKYLGIPLWSKRVGKVKFVESKIKKIFEEIDKLEYSGFAFNQMIRTIKNFITNKLYFCFANMSIDKKYLDMINRRIRKLINNFLKGQSLQLSFIYRNARNGGFGVPNMEDEYAAYKINHMANLLSTKEGKNILIGYLNINKKIAKNQDVIKSFEKALKFLKVELPD